MEQETTSPVEPEVVEANEQEAPATEEESFEEGEQQEVEATEELEVSFVDNKVQIPPGTPKEVAERIKEIGRQLQAGFTQKTQKVAEEYRSVEQMKQSIAQHAQMAQQFIGDMTELKSLDAQLEHYSKVDWQSYADQDPAAAQKHFMQYTALQNQRAAKAQSLESKQRELTTRQQQEQERLLAEGQRTLAEKIPDWGVNKQREIAKYAQEAYGFKAEELASVMDPRVVMLMNDAFAYKQSLAKAKQAKPAAQPEPVQKVGSTAPVAKSPEKMSMAEWLEWRERQIKRKQR